MYITLSLVDPYRAFIPCLLGWILIIIIIIIIIIIFLQSDHIKLFYQGDYWK